MSTYISSELRQRLLDEDQYRCAYCQTTQQTSGHPMVIDHIIPLSEEGGSEYGNLCLACYRCNEYKGSRIKEVDPLSGKLVNLFHPRTQKWGDHFAWDSSGTKVIGQTPTGRATIIALKMNNEIIVYARRNWVSVGWHPPDHS